MKAFIYSSQCSRTEAENGMKQWEQNLEALKWVESEPGIINVQIHFSPVVWFGLVSFFVCFVCVFVCFYRKNVS